MRVAVALWRLSTGNSFRTVASTFGIGKPTAVTITNDVIDSIVEFREDWIKFPRTIQETAESINRFSDEANSPLPQVVGAIDGSQIPIKAPIQNKESYFNRKHFYSMNLQGVVGGDCRFLDVAVGFPGSIHDARVLRMSGIYGRFDDSHVIDVHLIDGPELQQKLRYRFSREKENAEAIEDVYDGISIQSEVQKTYRAILLDMTVDAPARAIWMSMKQFNGYYGCGKCEEPGHARVRTHQEMKNNALMSISNQESGMSKADEDLAVVREECGNYS
ncbi:hypothetical protein QZH41_001866 [Actinostola sp. cb2023]|nr:hypothetical protein QZH41_001866 [Actinostola sp. cb2023]